MGVGGSGDARRHPGLLTGRYAGWGRLHVRLHSLAALPTLQTPAGGCTAGAHTCFRARQCASLLAGVRKAADCSGPSVTASCAGAACTAYLPALDCCRAALPLSAVCAVLGRVNGAGRFKEHAETDWARPLTNGQRNKLNKQFGTLVAAMLDSEQLNSEAEPTTTLAAGLRKLLDSKTAVLDPSITDIQQLSRGQAATLIGMLELAADLEAGKLSFPQFFC